MNYGISSRAYLARAKRCLERNDLESLFYAAFELRCGVEARMQEYLEVQEHISKKKRQGWHVLKLARNIEDAFRIGEKEAVLRVRDKNTNDVLFEARYTPVKKSLKKKVETLGNYLHAAKNYHAPDNQFWDKFRSELKEAAAELEYATSGRLLGPLLQHPNKKNVNMKLELPTPLEKEAVKWMAVGVETIFEIRYE